MKNLYNISVNDFEENKCYEVSYSTFYYKLKGGIVYLYIKGESRVIGKCPITAFIFGRIFREYIPVDKRSWKPYKASDLLKDIDKLIAGFNILNTSNEISSFLYKYYKLIDNYELSKEKRGNMDLTKVYYTSLPVVDLSLEFMLLIEGRTSRARVTCSLDAMPDQNSAIQNALFEEVKTLLGHDKFYLIPSIEETELNAFREHQAHRSKGSLGDE